MSSAKETARSYKRAADEGVAEAQFNYGLCLKNGKGVSRNLKEAARYFLMAADQEHARAQFNYGVCLENGQGVARDMDEAALYYKMAADKGVPQAQFNYGTCLYQGEGASRNLSEAARYFKMAADQGDVRGQFHYGLCLKNGEGVPRDLSEAARYFRMSADQGVVQAQFHYGVCLYGGDGVSRNLSEAARYFKMAAVQGYARAQFNYGLCLARGEGVSRNLRQSAHYIKMAADQGLAPAQVNYGVCLKMSEGVSRNLREAAHYFKMAADQGDARGQLNYGVCLQRGEGVSRDLKKAARYFEMAEAQKDDEDEWDSSKNTGDVCLARDVSVHYVKKEVKPLSEWILDVSKLEEVANTKLVSGGSGTVRVFRQKSNRKIIVGKFLMNDDSDDSQRFFEREICSLASLDHPCIVKFAGYTLPCPLTEHRFLIFTEYVSGGSLSSVIQKSSEVPWFSSTARCIIVVGIVLGMRYVHSHGIFHRDLKPSNVLLDENHHPHLCDFGSSRSFSQESTMTGLLPVTHYYAAPELCNEDGDYNEKIDVFSFGMMLYEIVTGNLALRHLNQLQVTAFFSQGKRPDIPSSVLPFTKKLIERCWSQNPSQRPSFNDIYDCLVDGRFRLFSDVDVSAVSAYGKSICDWEIASA